VHTHARARTRTHARVLYEATGFKQRALCCPLFGDLGLRFKRMNGARLMTDSPQCESGNETPGPARTMEILLSLLWDRILPEYGLLGQGINRRCCGVKNLIYSTNR
jgi:hypothetical protein